MSRLRSLFRPALWRTTAFRLAGFYMVVFFVVIGLGLAYIFWATIGVIEAENRAIIESEAESLATDYRRGGLARLIVSMEDRSAPGVRTDSVYLLANNDRVSLAGNLNSWPINQETENWITFPILKREGENLVPRQVLARIVGLPGGYRLLVGRDSEQTETFRTNFLNAIAWVSAATILIGIATGIFASRRILRRVERAAQAGEAIAAGNLDNRLPVAGTGDEFDRLASSLNSTLDRIEDLMSGMRIATDSISHDVRRPLTRLRAKLDLALRDTEESPDPVEAMGTALTEIDKTVLILDNLLKIARAEAGVARTNMATIDLAAIAEDALDLYGVLAEDKDITLTHALTPAPIRAEPQLLAQAIANLIDNAIKYTPEGGRISVATECDETSARITIADNGPGIAASDRARATDRFVRLDDDGSRATEGSGLGLSLVRAVAHMLGGTLELGDAKPGLKAEIVLPLQ